MLLYRLHLLYEIVPYYGLESCKLPHVLLHFNAFKVSEFNIKNEKCAGRFYLMGICPLCFLVKTLHQEWDFGRVEIKEFENSYWWVVILLLSRNHERSFPVHPEWEANSAHCFCNGADMQVFGEDDTCEEKSMERTLWYQDNDKTNFNANL